MSVVVSRSPGQHEVSTGVIGSRAGGTPLDGVDFFTVGLQVVDTQVLLHTPNLKRHKTHKCVNVTIGSRRSSMQHMMP